MSSIPLISIVVPIHNTEKYLEKCLSSIQRQVFTDFEVICVDDCSTDMSASIVQSYCDRDSRFKLIRHEKNLGAGGARNTGIRNCRAEFIASVDGDDYFSEEALQIAWDEMVKGNFDVVVFGYSKVDVQGNILSTHLPKPRELNLEIETRDIFNISDPNFWNKLWRKSLIIDNDIFFPDWVFFQDFATIPRIYLFAKKIKILDKSLCFYLKRNDSTTLTNSPKHMIDYLKVFDLLREFLIEKKLFDKHKTSFYKSVDRAMKFHSSNVLKSHLSDEDKRQYLSHLLILKIGYLECHRRASSYNVDDLLVHVKKSWSVHDVLTSPWARSLKHTLRDLFVRVRLRLLKVTHKLYS